jgi:hypothetical protein
MQVPGNQYFRHIGPHLPAHHLLGAHILKGTAVNLVADGQRQIGDIADPHAIALGRLRLVKQQVRSAAFSMGRIGGARHKSFGFQGFALLATQRRPDGLPPHLMPQLAQLDL